MKFTEREREVIALRFERGLCRKEIMNKLGISIQTTKFHIRNIYRKLGLQYHGHSAAVLAMNSLLEMGIIKSRRFE